jgi:hypothetical protein
MNEGEVVRIGLAIVAAILFFVLLFMLGGWSNLWHRWGWGFVALLGVVGVSYWVLVRKVDG